MRQNGEKDIGRLIMENSRVFVPTWAAKSGGRVFAIHDSVKAKYEVEESEESLPFQIGKKRKLALPSGNLDSAVLFAEDVGGRDEAEALLGKLRAIKDKL